MTCTRLALVALALLAVTGCTTRYIGTSQIVDTEENREVLRVVEQYRRAVEDRDVQRVLDLTSDVYFEDPGTPHDASDDYDKAGLKQRLEVAFGKVKEPRLEINARRMTLDEEAGRAELDYTFDYRYRLALQGPEAEGWRKESDVNRVSLQRENGAWKFVAGL